MISTTSQTATNPHISALKSAFDQATAPIKWFAIVHNDSRLQRALAKGLDGKSAAVLQVSQDTWDFQETELPDAIRWAFEQGEIEHLVLVGSSQVGGSFSRAALLSGKAEDGHNGFEALLGRVRSRSVHAQAIQEEFADRFTQLSKLSVVQNYSSSGKLSVAGLFYRAESGLFLHYNEDANSFEPLLGP